MQLQALNLYNFRNYEEQTFAFQKPVVCITGPNGSGKTNLLDAIYYLCITKSAFGFNDKQNIRHQAPHFIIGATIYKNEHTYQLNAAFQPDKKRSFKCNKVEYERLSEHIGQFPCVIITPNDTDLIREGSEERRKFFDTMLSQADTQYLKNLVHYNNALKQRNAFLEHFAQTQNLDSDLLDTYDHAIVQIGWQIAQRRQTFSQELNQTFRAYFAELTDGKEQVAFDYQTALHTWPHAEAFAAAFKQNRIHDLAAQRTTIGVHRDDYDFLMNNHPIKKFGSQGQQKSFVIALKLAQLQYIAQTKNTAPFLLLDDIFDKLDQHRIKSLVEMIRSGRFGQVFITDARPDRTHEFVRQYQDQVQIIEIKPA